jgi:hypothetical protein
MARITPRTQDAKVQSKPLSITAHRGFIPLIAVWFAAFMGLAILVLPGAQIARITMAADVTFLGGFARLVLTAVAAIIGAVVGYLIAVAIQHVTTHGVTVKPKADRAIDDDSPAYEPQDKRTRLLVPKLDLGSASLDEPVEERAPVAEPDEHSDEAIYADFERPNQDDEAIDPTASRWDEEDFEPHHDWAIDKREDPLTLTDEDDSWFDDAWVEQPGFQEPRDEGTPPSFEAPAPAFATAQKTGQTERPAPPPGFLALSKRMKEETAIDRLRGKRPEELSLVQMVERFAAALHERQAREPKHELDARDSALAEGLRALSLLAGDRPADTDTGEVATEPSPRNAQRELRDALAKLRDLSGAA